ncbi:hypothetical protein FBU30_004248 [Linnemannia zychae]|nr:hypothetical protein FBU30_004248 [Linnemannia zychae]
MAIPYVSFETLSESLKEVCVLDPPVPEGFMISDASQEEDDDTEGEEEEKEEMALMVKNDSSSHAIKKNRTQKSKSKETPVSPQWIQQCPWITEIRARNALGLIDVELLLAVMKKAPRLTTFIMDGFPFDNDPLIRKLADRLVGQDIDGGVEARLGLKSSSESGTRSTLTISSKENKWHEMGRSEFRKLELKNTYYAQVKVRTIEYLLNRCPPELEELVLSISFGSRAELDSEGDFQDQGLPQQEMENMENGLLCPLGSNKQRNSSSYDTYHGRSWNLRKLTIGGDLGGPGGLIWLPLVRRCCRLQSLSADLFTENALTLLSSTLQASCPDLKELSLRCMTGVSQDDGQIAELIQSSRAWKQISFSYFHGLGPLSTMALVQPPHSTTLETLILKECDGLCSEDIQAVLSSCVNLRIFQAMTSNGSAFSSTVYLDVNEMIDSPWVCLKLEKLKLVITGIARPDLKEDQYGKKLTGPLHDGSIQGYEMQQIVYSQLGQLTRLQELWLGHDDPDLDDEENYHQTEVEGQWKYIDPDEQFECLEFSMRSGLGLLEELKELRVLNIDRMNVRVGMSEVQWMADRWPKLEKIIGLVIHGEVREPKYIQWLRDHRPDVNLPPVMRNFTTWFSSRIF